MLRKSSKAGRATFAASVLLALATGSASTLLGADASQTAGASVSASKDSAASSASTGTPAEEPGTQSEAISRAELKKLENEVFAPLKGMSDQSLKSNPTMRYRPPQIQENPRVKEWQDRQKNWIFLDPNDADSYSDFSHFNRKGKGEEDKDNSALTPLEQFYQKQSASPADRRDKASPDPFRSRASEDQFASTGDDDKNSDKDEDRDRLNKNGKKEDSGSKNQTGFFDQDAEQKPEANDTRKRSVWSSIFGGDVHYTPSKDEIQAHKARMDDFKQLLGVAPAPSTGAKDFLANATAPANTPVPAAPLVSPPPSYKPADPLAGLPGATAKPSVPPMTEFTTRNYSPSAYVIPEPPVKSESRPIPSAHATFEPPRRPF